MVDAAAGVAAVAIAAGVVAAAAAAADGGAELCRRDNTICNKPAAAIAELWQQQKQQHTETSV